MPTGSCLCEAVKIEYTGEPKFRAICYCDDDRKMANMQVFQVDKSQFKVLQGEPKTWMKKSDFGNDITNHLCGTCGTVLFRTGGAAVNENNVGIRAGVLDDQTILNQPPSIEVFVERRPPWISKVEGAIQLNGRYEPIDEENAELMRKARGGA